MNKYQMITNEIVTNPILVINGRSYPNSCEVIDCFKHHIIETCSLTDLGRLRSTCKYFYYVFLEINEIALNKRTILRDFLRIAKDIGGRDILGSKVSREEYQTFFGTSRFHDFLRFHHGFVSYARTTEALKNLTRTVLKIAQLYQKSSITIKSIRTMIPTIKNGTDYYVYEINRLMENRQSMFDELSKDHSTMVGFEKAKEDLKDLGFFSVPYVQKTKDPKSSETIYQIIAEDFYRDPKTYIVGYFFEKSFKMVIADKPIEG